MRLSSSILWLLGLLIFSSLSAAEQSGRQGVYLAPGWGKLSFKAPDPGSYYLPIMQQSAGGKLIGTDGRQVDLADLLKNKVTLLSFIYRTCDDVNGCPLSTMVLRTVASGWVKNQILLKNLDW
jgi:cytochrome c peroxidase